MSETESEHALRWGWAYDLPEKPRCRGTRHCGDNAQHSNDGGDAQSTARTRCQRVSTVNDSRIVRIGILGKKVRAETK